jgi:hypothetical protein
LAVEGGFVGRVHTLGVAGQVGHAVKLNVFTFGSLNVEVEVKRKIKFNIEKQSLIAETQTADSVHSGLNSKNMSRETTLRLKASIFLAK